MIQYNIVNKIIEKVGMDDKSRWYVGIATYPRDRLFHDHNVNERTGERIYLDAVSEQNARDTEKYLLDNYPFRGGTGGGSNPRYIYAYKITPTTVE